MVDLRTVFTTGNEFVPIEFKENDERMIKVNIIDEVDGSSEGVWAYIKNPEDIEKYNRGESTDVFDVVLLNQPLTHMHVLRWGFIIQVKGTGEKSRPIMDNVWFEKQRTKLNDLLRAEQEVCLKNREVN